MRDLVRSHGAPLLIFFQFLGSDVELSFHFLRMDNCQINHLSLITSA